MKMRFATLALLVVILALVSSTFAQDATLRYKWIKGDEARYRISQLSNITMSGLPGIGEMTMETNMIQVVRMTVDDVAADGGVTLRQTFESVRIEQNSPIGKTVFDSTAKDPAADPTLAAIMSTMVGESVVMVLAPSGAVLKVDGMSRILEKMTGALPQSPVTAPLVNQLKASLSDDAMRSVTEQGFAIFPNHPVKVGETWTSQFQMNNPILGRLNSERSSTLKGIENSNGASVAHIAVTLAMKQGADSVPPGILGVSAKMGDSETQGEILFDVAKGRVQRSSLKSETPMSISLDAPGAGAINAKSIVRTTMVMEIVEK